MLTCRNIADAPDDLPRVKALYEGSFPENERRPIETLVSDRTGISDFRLFYDDGAFVGFASLLIYNSIAHIIYFAVESDMRGRGLGGRILDMICEAFTDCRVIADLELPMEGKPEYALRARREAFYRRRGFERTDIRYDWYGESYMILSKNGPVSPDEFHAFWLGIEAADSRFGDY